MMAPTSSKDLKYTTSSVGADECANANYSRRRGGGVPPVKLTEEQTLRFIELYREHECLWNTRSSDYRINRSRELAIESLRRRMGHVGGGGVLSSRAGQLMSADAVKKKINCLRTAFKQEHDKVLAKKCRNGSGGEYQPRLTWYNAFLFIRDYMVQRTSTASLAASKPESSTKQHETSMSPDGRGEGHCGGGGPVGNNVTIRWDNHADILVKGLAEFLKKQYLVDTDVSIRGETLKTHKMILALFLPTFKKSVDDVKGHLHGLNLDYVADATEDVRALIEFVYRGTVSVPKDRLGHLGRLAECLKFEGLSKAIRQLCDTSTTASSDGSVHQEITNKTMLDEGDIDADLTSDQDTRIGALDIRVETIFGENDDQQAEDVEDEEQEFEDEEEDEVNNYNQEYFSSEMQDEDDHNEDDGDDEVTNSLQNYPVETVLVENDDQDVDRLNSPQCANGGDNAEDLHSPLRFADIQGTYRSRGSRVLRSFRWRQRTDKSAGGGGTTSKVSHSQIIVRRDLFPNANNNNNNNNTNALEHNSLTRAEYFRQWRNHQTMESREARLASQARLMRERRSSETDEARQQRLHREATRVRERRLSEAPESRRIRREKHACLMRERRLGGQLSENSSQEPYPVQVTYYDDYSSSMNATNVTDSEDLVGQNTGFYINDTGTHERSSSIKTS